LEEETLEEETSEEETSEEETSEEETSQEKTLEEEISSDEKTVTMDDIFSKKFPLVLDLSDEEGFVTVTMTGCRKADSDTEWEGFPAYVKYSLDGGTQYTVLAQGGTITADAAEAVNGMLLIDFSHAKMDWASKKDADQDLLQILEGAENPVLADGESWLLTLGGSSEWDTRIEKWNGSAYEQMTEEQVKLKVSESASEGEQTMTILAEEAEPGIYRLVLEAVSGKQVMQTKKIVFGIYR
jgi:hypothetical protein